MYSNEIYKRVIEYAPYIYYHPNEKYYMMDVNNYFKITDEKLTGRKGRKLKGKYKNYKAPFKRKVNVYYTITEFPNEYYINYYLYSAYNGSKRLLGLLPIGWHNADVETVEAHFTKENKLISYNLSNHGDFVKYGIPTKGVTLKNNLDVNDEGSPIVYMAVNSHGLYSNQGTYMRFWGFGNDITVKGKGVKTIPQLLTKNNAIMQWQYNLGDDGISNYMSRIQRNEEKKNSYIQQHRKIPNIFTWLVYSLYLVLPITYSMSVGGNTNTLIINTIISLFIQFMILKIILTNISERVGLGVPEDEHPLQWIIPFRLY